MENKKYEEDTHKFWECREDVTKAKELPPCDFLCRCTRLECQICKHTWILFQ